jgi:hypothetical protein
MRQLDEVDRSHLRETGKRVLEMFQGFPRKARLVNRWPTSNQQDRFHRPWKPRVETLIRVRL